MLPTAATVAGAEPESHHKKAGDDNSARHTCGEFSEKIGKDIKQFLEMPPLAMMIPGEDEHRNCQQGEGIETSEHGTDQIFGSYRKGRVKHRRKHRCDSKGNRYRNSDDQQCNKIKIILRPALAFLLV